ncbi:hypothetical protein PIB30_030571 [Stylosanthes scabra]|uniref:Uncharacterized protein n=1 Tax=Stylosanthes scabra TaxID=79078 RepID=A0ABU6TDF2_9FABA|nr:hypothetical protein [Stylosanthes scabra]
MSFINSAFLLCGRCCCFYSRRPSIAPTWSPSTTFKPEHVVVVGWTIGAKMHHFAREGCHPHLLQQRRSAATASAVSPSAMSERKSVVVVVSNSTRCPTLFTRNHRCNVSAVTVVHSCRRTLLCARLIHPSPTFQPQTSHILSPLSTSAAPAPAPFPVISAPPPSTTLLGLATSSRRPAVPTLLHRLPVPATPSLTPIAFSARPVAVPARASVPVPSNRLTVAAPLHCQPATPLKSENGTSVI